MKITSVYATCHNVPFNLPHCKEPLWRDATCVYLETDEGVTGFGLTSIMNRFAIKEYILRDLGPFLLGQNPLSTEWLWQEMFCRFNRRAMTGVITCAMSALDIALWDIKGKIMGQPIYRLLGGYAQRVPVYATFGLLSYSREELVSVAKALVSEGYNKLKMVVGIDGADNLPEDQARVEALRKGVGDDVQIIVDANHLFSLRQAVELARRIEPYNITWFEEPVHNNDVKDLAELRTRTFIPIAAGQQEGMRWRHRDLIAGNAVDIVQTDAALVGGFSEGLKVAHFAQAYNLPIATHGYVCPHINMHLVAGVANGWLVEFHALGQKLSEVIFVNPPKAEKGWVTLLEKPGLGMDINHAALKEYEES